jgi:hypothetical protein
VLALLIGLRVALPHIVKKYVNKKLDEMPKYGGRIGDVDMHLWRGAYSIQDIEIIKTDGKVPVPFFDANRATFSREWKALFNGALVGEIDFCNPVMNFVQGPTRQTSQVGVDKPWLDVIKKLFPLDINRFAVHNGMQTPAESAEMGLCSPKLETLRFARNVADTGLGITEEELPRIFGEFFQGR